MASLIKQSGRYYLQFYDAAKSPQRKKVALKARRKKDAKPKQLQLESAYLAGEFDPWTDDPFSYGESETAEPLEVGVAVGRFLNAKKEQGCAESTVTTYEKILRRLEEIAGTRSSLDSLAASQIKSETHAKGISKATARKRYTHVRAFLGWAREEGHMQAKPLEGVSKPKRPSKRPKHVTQKELHTICEAIRQDYQEKLSAGQINEGELIWLIPLYRFAFYSGLRGSELARLRWKDLDFERGLILLSDKQKSKEEGTSPLIPKAVKVLHEVPQGEPEEYVFRAPKGERFDRRTDTFRDYVNRRFRRYRREAGIERKLSVHGLRHGFATRLAQEGVSPHAIQRACRHKAFRTTQKYINLSAVDVRDDVADAFS